MHRIVLDHDRVQPQLPPYEEISHEAIRDAAARWDATKSTLRERRQDVVELEQTREAAEWRDAEAAEAARAASKPEPKRSHVQEHDKKLDAARHELKIATLAEGRAFDGLQEALDAHQGEWLADATREIEALSKVWSAAVATLAELHGKLAHAQRSRTFASNGDREADGSGVLTGAIRVGQRDVQGLAGQGPNAIGTLDVGFVFAELAAMARVPEPEPSPERETETVNILGATRTVPRLNPERRDERLARAGSRRSEREAQQEADSAALEVA
jgi:hypothetical protein